MNDETIVAVFDTAEHARAAQADLVSAGVAPSAIGVHAGAGTITADTTATPVREEGFWASLFGGDTYEDSTVYDRSVAGGSTVVTVKALDEHIARVMEILESHHPVDIDERAATYGLTTTTPMPPSSETSVKAGLATTRADGSMAIARAGEETMQLSAESLAVGKRLVNRGGTRIRRYVVETPVEESVTLHDEKVVLDRRPVTDDRPADAHDFTDRTIEMMESVEEAVVSKTARVVEEVGLRKEATERVETVRDTVRKEEVEVVKVPAAETAASVGAVSTTGGVGGTTIPLKR